MRYLLLLLILIVACSTQEISKTTQVAITQYDSTSTTVKQATTTTTLESDLAETSPNIPCEIDEDCWCRRFDGSKFLPGKESGVGLCCTEDRIGKTFVCSNENSRVNHCGNCFYA